MMSNIWAIISLVLVGKQSMGLLTPAPTGSAAAMRAWVDS